MNMMLRTAPVWSPWDRFVTPAHRVHRRPEASPSTFRPAANIRREAEAYVLTLAVPGRQKEDFRLELDQDTLVVRGEGKDLDGTYTRREFSLESFERRFRLADNIDTGAVAATYTDGLLRITLPLKAEAQPQTREITIA